MTGTRPELAHSEAGKGIGNLGLGRREGLAGTLSPLAQCTEAGSRATRRASHGGALDKVLSDSSLCLTPAEWGLFAPTDV